MSKEQLKALSDLMEKTGFTPYFGFFGVAGPVGTGYGCLGRNDTVVVYFNTDQKTDAARLAEIARQTLAIPAMNAQNVDPKSLADHMQRFVVENSGIDFQICISR